jgi:hypothetical protein
MIAQYVGFLHAEELLGIFWCRIYFGQNCAQYVGAACCAQFCLLYIFYTEEFPEVLLHARDQHIKQTFHAVIVFPGHWPVRAETCGS